ncbi:hypothetical protein CLOLEP_02378 [[Clostridium] leptum DSM 753]|uniref:Uncharacterized protein n=1 Tax=[Clostridium] leptum DSM 753 TaxID=428125 RepID=A7VUY1_9FIRM|nr:hypothetical protein CLOLEP_02378 [[Clostridium] leptum DSM 753]
MELPCGGKARQSVGKRAAEAAIRGMAGERLKSCYAG